MKQQTTWSGPDSLRALLVPVATLKPDEANARRHPKRNLAAIRDSLAAFGQRKPIVVQRGSGVVLAGNGTLAAARELGWSQVAAVMVDDDAEAAVRFSIADNRAGELAEWDDAALLAQLVDAPAPETIGFDIDDVLDLREPDPFQTTRVALATLKRHPLNYRQHPQEQLDHIMHSIRLHGFYRNVVVARDGTVLAGHGVVEAARQMGRSRIPVVRLDLDPHEPRALKVLASDNEIGGLAETDDRALTDLLRTLVDVDDLAGTGFDAERLAAMVYATRTREEVGEKRDGSSEWVGMPEFEVVKQRPYIIVSFDTPGARADLAQRLGVEIGEKTKSLLWPPRKQREDEVSTRFEG